MLIGIGGAKNVGKDTVATFFVEQGFVRYAFADHIREASSEIFQIPITYFTDTNKKDCPFLRKKWFGLVKQEYEVKLDYHTKKRLVSYFVSKYKTTKILENMEVLKNKSFKTPREIMKFIGTRIIRDYIGKDFHIRYLFEQILSNGDQAVVISDVRHRNERQAISEIGGINILVTRPGVSIDDDEGELGDPSEYDFIINNNKDLRQLRNSIDEVLVKILNKKRESDKNLHQ